MPLQIGQVCNPEEISEAIGTYDVGFISMLSGPSAFVTTAVMAENSSPLEGVDLSHICILVTHNCVKALTLRSNPDMFSQEVPLGLVNTARARLYTLPLVKILPLVLCKIREESASLIVVAPNWPNQSRFPDLREMVGAPLGEFHSGGTCCLKRMAQYGTPAWSCVAFMCGCFRDLRGARHPSFLSAGHTHRVLCAFHGVSLCSKMGSVCEMV